MPDVLTFVWSNAENLYSFIFHLCFYPCARALIKIVGKFISLHNVIGLSAIPLFRSGGKNLEDFCYCCCACSSSLQSNGNPPITHYWRSQNQRCILWRRAQTLYVLHIIMHAQTALHFHLCVHKHDACAHTNACAELCLCVAVLGRGGRVLFYLCIEFSLPCISNCYGLKRDRCS